MEKSSMEVQREKKQKVLLLFLSQTIDIAAEGQSTAFSLATIVAFKVPMKKE